jgi:hypothetical protein
MSRFRLIAVLSTLATALLAPSAASADTAVQDLLFQYNLSNLRQQGARPVAATSLIQLTAANAVMTGNRTKACRGHSKRTVWWARYGPRANQRTYKVCRSKHQVVVAKPARLGPKLKLRSLMRADLLTTLEALKRPTAHLPKEDAWITQVTGMVFPLSVVPSPKGLAIVLPCQGRPAEELAVLNWSQGGDLIAKRCSGAPATFTFAMPFLSSDEVTAVSSAFTMAH